MKQSNDEPDTSLHLSDLQAQLERTREQLHAALAERDRAEAELRQVRAAYAATLGDVAAQRQVEATLRRYEGIVSATLDWISLVDHNYVYQLVNQTYLKLNNKTYDQIVGRKVSDLVGDAVFTATIKPRLDEVLAGAIVQYQAWFEYAGAGRRLMHITYTPYVEADGSISGVLVSGRDITEQAQAEARLHERERFIQGIADASPVLLYVYSRTEQRPLYVNREVVNILGYTPDEIAAMGPQALAALVHPDDLAGVVAAHIARRNAGPPGAVTEIECRLRHKDGTWRWLVSRELIYKYTPDGEVSEILGVAQDITERKLHAAQIHLQARMLDVVGQAVIATDLAGVIQYWNRGAEQLYGWPAVEVIGRNAVDVLVSGPDRDQAMAIMAALRAGASWSGEFAVRHRDGSRMEMLVNDSPIYDSRGDLIGTLGVSMDITERKHMETALREKEMQLADERAFLALVLETLDEGVMVCDADGNLLYYNRAMEVITGYSRAEAESRDLLTLFCPDPVDLADAGSGAGGLPRTLIHKDGSTRQVLFSLGELNREGRALRICSLRDVTRQREAEAQQQRLEQKMQEVQRLESLGVLAGGIAHDFNNWLAIILGNAELVLEELPADSPLRIRLNQIATVSHRAANLTRQMLVYAGKGQVVIDAVLLNDIIRNDEILLAALVGKGVRIQYDLAPRLPLVMADSGQLRQVLMNLVINASEAIGESEGLITITTTSDRFTTANLEGYRFGLALAPGEYVLLTVADTGAGMDPATREHIFDPFFTTKFLGRGLGLAVVLSIVQRHGGAIEVQSAPDQGTVFTVALPVAPVASPTTYAGSASGDLRPVGVVLVVDDEPGVQFMTRDMLTRLGYKTLGAGDGATALVQVQILRDELAFVLLDLTMPGMNGVQVAEQIQRMTTRLPIILMSGYSINEVEERFKDRGIAGFLQKPFGIEALRAVVQRVLATWGVSS